MTLRFRLVQPVGHEKPIVVFMKGHGTPINGRKSMGFPGVIPPYLWGLEPQFTTGIGVHLVVTVVEFPKLRIFSPFWT